MKLALTAILTLAATGLAATGLAAPTACAQQIEYVQRPDRSDGLYPRVLRGGDAADTSNLLGADKGAKSGNRYGHGKMIKVAPNRERVSGVRVYKAGKVSTTATKRSDALIKPTVYPRAGRVRVIPVEKRKNRKGTVIFYKPSAFRAVPDQGKSD